jgi:hypothetical protein
MNTDIISADNLINQLRIGSEESPGMALFHGLLEDESWKEKLRRVRISAGKTLAPFSIDNNVLQVAPLTAIWQPLYSPFLVSENLASARAILADCFELRRRIESLQLDIFNFEQDQSDFESSAEMHADNLANIESTRVYWVAVRDRRAEELNTQQESLEAWTQFNESFGSNAPGYNTEQRTIDKVRRDFSSFAMAPSDRVLNFTSISNTDAASVASAGLGDPAESTRQIHLGSRRDALRTAETERVQVDSELRRLRNQTSSLEAGIVEAELAIQRAAFEFEQATKKWALRKRLWERKRRQYGERSGIGLRRRLADSVYLYDKVTSQLRGLLHSIEFGQSVIFDLDIDGFDPKSLTLLSRYTFSAREDTPVTTDDLFGPSVWISMDELAGLLIDAENRQRIVLQRQRVFQNSYLFEGVADATGRLSIDLDLGKVPQVALGPKIHRRRLCSLRLINESGTCDVNLILKSAERFNGADLVEDELDKIVRRRSASASVSGLQRADVVYMPDVLPNQAQYLNRHFDGTLSVQVVPDEVGSPVRLRLEVVTARA